MSDRYARCLNFDYCTLGDRRLVMRLAPGEPFFCPECAHALASARAWRSSNRMSWPAIGTAAMGAAAIAACVLVVQHWPQQIAAFVPHWMARVRTVAAPDAVDIIRGTAPPDGMPDPGKLFLAATMDESMPHGPGSYILREHHRRPPRSDPAAIEVMAQLNAGVQGLPAPERLTSATMPWHQAMIMAALLAPGQSLGPAGVPQLPVNPPADPDPVPNTAPAPAAAAQAPQFAAPPPAGAMAQHPVGAPAAPGAMRKLDRRAERGLIWHASDTGPPPAPQNASLATPVDDTPQTVPSPNSTKPPVAHKSAQAAAPAVQPPAPPSMTVTDVPPDDAPPPTKRIVVVPDGGSVTFGPLNRGMLGTEPIQPVFIPLRPSAAKPQEAKLTLNCIIETSGVPTHCRVESSTHAGALSDAMANWLSSGMVRRQPKSVDGRLVRSRQTIVLNFPAESQAPEAPK